MPLYIDIMNQLASEITTGKYRPGNSLPSERDLCLRFNTSQKSIRNALSILQQDGYIYKKRGSGSFVRKDQRRNYIINLGIVINYQQDLPIDNILSNPYIAQILKGANHSVAKHGANSSIFIYDGRKEHIEDSDFTGYRFDGFLNFYFTVSDALNTYLTERHMKVVSTATSFTLDRYNNTYTYPCVINDYLAGVEQSLLYYQQDGLNRFGFFASGKHGLHNYELYKQIFKRNNAEFILKYTAICPESSQTTNSVTERTKYYARTLFDQDLPHVIFSDGEANIREVISLLSESRDGQKILEKIRFCTIGTPGVSSNYFGGNVDLITPNNEKLGEVTAEKLIEFIKNGNLRENRYYVPSIFVPQKITQQGGIS